MMVTNKTIPNSADLKPYSFAVAGHDGTLCDPDGELFIKPCTAQEIAFYESAHKDHPRFADLMPGFLGTLTLNDVTDVDSLNEQLPAVADHISQSMKEEAVRMAKEAAADAVEQATKEAAAIRDNVKWKPNKSRKIATNQSVVLENTAYGFKSPNILDAKLGARLWADDAPLEKRQRFDEISRATTNGSHGFRIAGMRVFKGCDNPAEWDSHGYKIYDKDYGRLKVTPKNVVDEMRKFIFNSRAGVDEDLGRAIAAGFVNDLRHVEEVLASEESRMYSASLLFTFEGDGEALRAALKQQEEMNSNRRARESSTPATGKKEHGLIASRVDSGIVMDDEGQLILNTGDENGRIVESVISGLESFMSPIQEDGVMDFRITGEPDGGDDEEDDDEEPMPRFCSLKLIDFAHAEWVPGKGPDENVLKGVRSLIDIFEELSK
ncbi:inositol polyphosphate kinase-domain-containing protein [Podospora didyma]|uniref:Kinase n=1 Tax=Podospora didyma TaxID=330526 RepID=A0AAE0NX09_9PEZI|nr:inositol polyphosphate kinase-domain-containing protein [Podospora didyma]